MRVVGSSSVRVIFFHQQLFDRNMLLIKNKSCLYIQISIQSSLNRKNLIILCDMTRIRTGDSEIWWGVCAIFNSIFSPVICILFRFKVCANSTLQTHEFSADYSVGPRTLSAAFSIVFTDIFTFKNCLKQQGFGTFCIVYGEDLGWVR